MKKYLQIITLRWLAVFDVLFAKHFELRTFKKNGTTSSETNLNSWKEWSNPN